MTALTPDRHDNVLHASEADLAAAIAGALSRSGFTYAQLARQARSGDFESIRARLAWVAIGDLKDKAPRS
jgi:hypothetical protein